MKKFIVALMTLVVIISSFAFALESDGVYKGFTEAVTMLGDGALAPQEGTPAPVTQDIKVQLDGQYIDFTDSEGNKVNPKILNNRTMVPMRKIFETFDAQVAWDEPTRTVTATKAGKEIKLVINNQYARVKDIATGAEATITLDQAPVIYENRTLVPIRFIAESLDKEVGWDATTRTVIIIDMQELTKYLAQRVTSLQKLFDMNIEAVQSFKSASKITGSLSYVDNGANQSLKINGNANIAVNKSEEMESAIKLAVTGSAGSLMDAIKDSGYENVDAKVILKGDKLFVGLKDGADYKWTDASSAMSSVNNVSIAYNVDKMADYSSVMQFIKSSLGELNENSYATMRTIIDSLSYVLSDKAVDLSVNGATKKLTIDLDFGSFLKAYSDGQSPADIKLKVVLVAENGKISSEDISIDAKLDLSGEAVNLNFAISSTYSDLNSDIVITAPNV